MRLVVSWLRNLAPKPLVYSIQYHADQDLEELRSFWGRELAVDPAAIRLQRKSNSNALTGRTWRSAYGVLTVTSNDTYLRARLQAWIDRIRKQWLDSPCERGVAQPGQSARFGSGRHAGSNPATPTSSNLE
jgi:hypothetical protein